jgi:hypothetical protein
MTSSYWLVSSATLKNRTEMDNRWREKRLHHVFVCFVVVAPSLSSVERAAFCGVIALAGIGYSCSTLFRISSRYVAATSFMDRLWYPLIPAAGYLILGVAILEPLIRSSSVRPSWIAIAVSILLLAGIRNA